MMDFLNWKNPYTWTFLESSWPKKNYLLVTYRKIILKTGHKGVWLLALGTPWQDEITKQFLPPLSEDTTTFTKELKRLGAHSQSHWQGTWQAANGCSSNPWLYCRSQTSQVASSQREQMTRIFPRSSYKWSRNRSARGSYSGADRSNTKGFPPMIKWSKFEFCTQRKRRAFKILLNALYRGIMHLTAKLQNEDSFDRHLSWRWYEEAGWR